MYNEICLQTGRQIQLSLIKLFYINKYLKETENEVEQKLENLQNLKKTHEKEEKLLKEKIREKTALSLDMTSSENRVKEMVGNLLVLIIDFMEVCYKIHFVSYQSKQGNWYGSHKLYPWSGSYENLNSIPCHKILSLFLSLFLSLS